jgi:hypothetical protein
MRGEMSMPVMWVALGLLAGAVLGRFAVPLFEPRDTYLIEIFSEPNARECPLSIGYERSVLGRLTGMGEEYNSIECGKQRAFGDAIIQCRCRK